MREHVDFADGANPPGAGCDATLTVPEFRIVKQQSTRNTLVLDVSGSMSGDRIVILRQACNLYISSWVSDGSELGMVKFNSLAEILSTLVTIDAGTRADLLTEIPATVGGSTSIGAGLQKGIQVLQEGDNSTTGGCLVLITDGEENTSPMISDVLPNLISKGICVDVIAVTQAAADSLEPLTTATGGRIYLASLSNSSNALAEALAAIATRGQSELDQAVSIYSDARLIDGGAIFEFSLAIDASIGKDTEFTFTYLGDQAIEVTLHTPDGSIINKDSASYDLDSTFKMVTIKIEGIADVGSWTASIYNPSSVEQQVYVMVRSKSGKPGEYPITVRSEWSANTINPPEKLILYVTVSKGAMPVLNAHVVATVERPSGDSVQLIMADSGSGADITKDDGVYSSYFTAFAGDDRYSVKVEVVDAGDDTVISPSRIVGYGSFTDPERVSGEAQPDDESTGTFQRTTNGGSVSCDGSTECSGLYDFYSPAKIVDLRVTKISYDDRHITIQFTAPGDDLDFGDATSYEIWMHTDFSTMHSNHEDTTNTTQDLFIEGVLSSPKSPGQTETFTIIVPTQGDIAYVFCVVAIDDGGNKSPRSNIVSASMKYFPQPTSYLVTIIVISVIAVVLLAVFITTLVCIKHKNRPKPGLGPVA
uniref:Calcium-activated chloride channel regulator 4-like n=1 Tax=Saccoglossus kowalevskii TaxID=10224 RepID=A0ABM0MS82_SACKO|nr:PREDICTED: calcium-activated chloride channel regulator 4-like [Saccoglossus kowalevskii]